MELRDIPVFYEWARRHVWGAILCLILCFFLVASYQFIGGYANRFGINVAGGEYGAFKRSVASYTVVDTMLQRYLVQYHASRIGIARFHDSLKDIGNNSLFFVTFESVVAAPGVASNIDELKDLPAITFASILPQLLDDKPVFKWTKDLPNGPLRELAVKRGVIAGAFVPVNDLNGRLVGMLTMTWLYKGDIPNEQQRGAMVPPLREAADRLGAYFSARE